MIEQNIFKLRLASGLVVDVYSLVTQSIVQTVIELRLRTVTK